MQAQKAREEHLAKLRAMMKPAAEQGEQEAPTAAAEASPETTKAAPKATQPKATSAKKTTAKPAAKKAAVKKPVTKKAAKKKG
jgi:hypothetical protein